MPRICVIILMFGCILFHWCWCSNDLNKDSGNNDIKENGNSKIDPAILQLLKDINRRGIIPKRRNCDPRQLECYYNFYYKIPFPMSAHGPVPELD